MILPEKFLERMKQMLGGEYYEFLRTYEEPRRFGLRVNTLKISVEEFTSLVPFHLKEIPWTSSGFYYEKEDDPARHPFYYAGLYYLQEPSAMTPAELLPVMPGERVLDLCAAPGGKATALAAKLGGRGLLVANDISASRAKALLKNLELSGVPNSFVTNTAPAKLADQFPEAFDKILVDAPCSGEGMFRKDIANAKVWSPQKVASCAAIQRDITVQAVRMLRPGGLLLYSTCTFSVEENEGTVAYLLDTCPDMELVELPWKDGFVGGGQGLCGWTENIRTPGACLELPGLVDPDSGDFDTRRWVELEKCVRIFPHRMGGEGHFLALLKKKGELPPLQTEDAVRMSPAAVQRGKEPQAYSGSGRKNRKSSGKTVFRNSASENRASRDAFTKQFLQKEEEDLLRSFLKDIKPELRMDQVEVHGGFAYYVPERLQLSGRLPFLRNGLYLGELKRGRFEPAQSLAMALDGYASCIDFDSDDPRIRRYLCGETVEVDDRKPVRESGWQLVCVCGYPLGWGRLVNGTLKNKYPPGWRMQV